MAVGKISGASAMLSHLARKWRSASANASGSPAAPVASQVIQRDRHAQYLSALALIAATLEKIALEIRHLQRTEVREAEEPSAASSGGAVPHAPQAKSCYCEQICGLARLVRSNLLAAFETSAFGRTRISTVRRTNHLGPIPPILVDYMLSKK